MPTYCTACRHVEPQSKKQHQRYWLCMRHKNLEGMGFVDPTHWALAEPYLRCAAVNGGACELFEPLERPHADL
jgi:hypothetical protein